MLGVFSAKCTQAYTYKYSKMRHFGSVKQRLPPSLLKDPQDKLGKSRRCLFGFVSDIYLGERFAYFAHNYMSVKGESHFPELLFVGLFFIGQPLIMLHFAADPWTLLDWHVTVQSSALEVKPKKLSYFCFLFQDLRRVFILLENAAHVAVLRLSFLTSIGAW